MKKVEEMKRILKEHKNELKEDYGISEIGLFGSYVSGEQKESSDIDVLVEFHNATDLLSFVHLKNHLSNLLEANVDLVMKRALKPEIGERVLREVVYLNLLPVSQLCSQVKRIGLSRILKRITK